MKYKKILISFACCVSLLYVHAQLVDKTPAAIPQVPTVYNGEPYEDPSVSGINRNKSRATEISWGLNQAAEPADSGSN